MIEIVNISKRFGQMYALREVNLRIEPGTIHGLVGENGAGKSTLIKILTGVYHLDSGEVRIDGVPVIINTPQESQNLGISVIHQDRNLVPSFNGIENVYLGKRGIRKAGGIMDFKAMKKEIKKVMQANNIEVPIERLARDMTPPQKTLLEITRAIMTKCKLLILDEPTAALTDKETEVLFSLLRKLRSEGTAILYVSHRMDEIFAMTDRISVMKNGELVRTLETKQTDRNEVIALMTDNWKNDKTEHAKAEYGDVLLSCEHLATLDGVVKDASFEARAGQILGIFGLGGSGRTELLEAIYGLRGVRSGSIKQYATPYEKGSPSRALQSGMVLINEDRRGAALVPSLSVRENIVLSTLKNYRKGMLFDGKKEKSDAERLVKELQIKTTGINQQVAELSGGNQQKVVFAKALMSNPRIFLCDEPTQAVDVKTRAEIHTMLREYANKGSAVVLVTSDLKEMLEVADDILILSGGRTREQVRNENVTAEQILHYCYAEN